MFNLKFAVGVVIAGALAFGANFAGMAITAPMLHGIPTGSISSQDEPTELAPGGDAPDYESLLIGRWQAPEPANQDAFVEFNEYGLWTASDGCNGAQGDWNVEPDGTFDGGAGGAMTLIWCDNVAIPTAVWDADRVEVTEDGKLTLTNDKGEELKLVRTSDAAFSLAGSWIHKGDSANETSAVEFSADGTWVGGVGCAEFSGTWELATANVPFAAEADTDSQSLVRFTGPAILVIGPEPSTPGATCPGAPKEFVLNYDTEYQFYAEDDGAFSLGMVQGEPGDAPLLRFTRG